MIDLTFVLEAQASLTEAGYDISSKDLFSYLLDRGIIDENGAVTDYAFEMKLVKEIEEEANMPFSEFLDHYPVFEDFDPKHFKLIDGYWEADDYVLDRLDWLKKTDSLTPAALYELQYFFTSRKLVWDQA